ncbi:hypothetical protein DET57_11062 [Klebsiella oxytoca]|uniref:Fimbrial protein n=1 Tax=Klebsiella oxytoca TaxID=571 RepID=A0A318FN06_KLEOX|nr:molecular chaperone [Klebsiella oxytoca]PXW43948.1 hypothetical protein DET57_11062 [Klebsiella oxytoca]
MFIRIKAPVVVLATVPLLASGAFFNAVIYEIPSDKTFISQSLYNDTPRNNMYTISAWKIAKPGAGDEPVLPNQGELLYAPLRFNLPPRSSEYFRLYYKGPEDDLERYYRVVFKETPVTLLPFRDRPQKMDVMPVVAMSTILVVRPRKPRLEWQIDERKGELRNIGNTFFRVIIHQGCAGDDERSTQFYMLPGERYSDASLVGKNRKYLVANQRYFALGNACFDAR